jgi:hypothetical protein
VDALLGPTACSPATCGDTAACHSPVADDSGVVSDLSTATFGGGFRVVDDFKITSPGANQSLTKVCWYGFYFDYSVLAGCVTASESGSILDIPDDFRLTIYFDLSGLPGNPVANAQAVTPLNLIKTGTGETLNYLNHPVARIKYEADLPAGITVDGGGCYWLEIVNRTSGSCLWHWETAANSGNGVSIQQPGRFAAGTCNFYSFNLAPQDQSFCLPGLRISSTDCGLPLGRCCIYPVGSSTGTCSIQTKPNCEIVMPGPGDISRWTLGADCSLPCPLLPLNDECSGAFLITSGPIYTGSTIHATLDGPGIPCEQNCGGQCNTAPDVWYRWVATLSDQATFTMCDPINGYGFPGCPICVDSVNYPTAIYRYDAIMVLYDNCPANGGSEVPGGCNDDGCSAGGQASTVSKIVLNNVNANTTYWIRITGWSGNRGNFTLRVNQP